MYTKVIVDLTYEVRKRVPEKTKQRIKLANPSFIDDLIELYFESSDDNLKDIIQEIIRLAGTPWTTSFQQQIEEESQLE